MCNRSLYWSDWGQAPRIERMSMDGTNRTALHTTGLLWPNALTLDYSSQTLYWADAGLDRVEASNVDGTNRRVLFSYGANHPFGMEFFNGNLFITDWNLKAVLDFPITQPSSYRSVISNLIFPPMSIKVVSLERQPLGNNNINSSSLFRSTCCSAFSMYVVCFLSLQFSSELCIFRLRCLQKCWL